MSDQPQTIRGTITRIRNQTSTGWGVFEIQTADGATVPVVGILVGIREREEVSCEGYWHEHPRFGQQFNARKVAQVDPDTNDGVIAWLKARLPSIGDKRARAMVERWPGEDLWRVIEEDPAQLATLDGITGSMTTTIAEAYKAHKAERGAMVQLKQWGLTDNQVGYCLKASGSSAPPKQSDLARVVERIQGNPYWLCESVHGFGFKRADEVAAKLGVPTDSPLRIRAGMIYVMEGARQSGHVFVWAFGLQDQTVRELGVHGEAVFAVAREMKRDGAIRVIGNRIYLPHLDRAEQTVADAIRSMVAPPDAVTAEQMQGGAACDAMPF